MSNTQLAPRRRTEDALNLSYISALAGSTPRVDSLHQSCAALWLTDVGSRRCFGHFIAASDRSRLVFWVTEAHCCKGDRFLVTDERLTAGVVQVHSLCSCTQLQHFGPRSLPDSETTTPRRWWIYLTLSGTFDIFLLCCVFPRPPCETRDVGAGRPRLSGVRRAGLPGGW